MQQNFVTGLKLKNSLSNQLVTLTLFSNCSNPEMGKILNGIPVDQQSMPKVTWAMPGIKINNVRNYICNDMIRRVMRDYFGYNIQVCV